MSKGYTFTRQERFYNWRFNLVGDRTGNDKAEN